MPDMRLAHGTYAMNTFILHLQALMEDDFPHLTPVDAGHTLMLTHRLHRNNAHHDDSMLRLELHFYEVGDKIASDVFLCHYREHAEPYRTKFFGEGAGFDQNAACAHLLKEASGWSVGQKHCKRGIQCLREMMSIGNEANLYNLRQAHLNAVH